MQKRVVVLILSLLILCMVPMQVLASEQTTNSIVSPMWVNIIDYQNTFSISSSGAATVNTTLNAETNINKVVLTASIQQYNNGNWTTIKSWASTSYSNSGSLYQTRYLISGYYYRMVSNGSVYQDELLVENTSYTSSSRWY
ncbi:hypothetical protein [Desulfosporosinus sp. OT]|uniref:hypothetical protein n=1 Tax=Desulfosporosinus sp. OT TaxID=913865 RepID=UPI000223A1D9|nr:hypothetical protein [Desulfosporosinus sp. OT]EGW37201.1 hypothetical protein DOT_4740 [Desulfosporosinus sp. OT]